MNLRLFPLPAETIHGTSRAVQSGRRTCVDVVQGCLAQIETWEPKVRAWVSLDRVGALQLAQERDNELAAGRSRGPLHGIPIGIKDIIDIAGLPTAAGSELLSR